MKSQQKVQSTDPNVDEERVCQKPLVSKVQTQKLSKLEGEVSCDDDANKENVENQVSSHVITKQKMYYRTSWERQVICKTLKISGLIRTKKKKRVCALYWTHHLPRKILRNLDDYQRVNHFPDSWCIGRKDRLIRCFEKAGNLTKGGYNEFVPRTYLLPRDYENFKKAARRKKKLFIMKPVASSCGKGIKLIRNRNDIEQNRKCVIQQYIRFPYLIGEKKFDLRLYCLVTSFDPLRAYLYREGIARFASKAYSSKAQATKYSFLTNFSVNKKILPNETEAKRDELKWTLSRFWQYIHDTEGCKKKDECIEKIKDIAIKTLIAADAEITPALRSTTRSRRCCFELFGFDIILDKTLRPWLLEVNISPSLMVKTDIDRQIKFPLVSDMFHLIGLKNQLDVARKERDQTTCNNFKQSDETSFDMGRLPTGKRQLILDHKAELSRLGNFQCIYPCAPSCEHYFELFQDKLNRRNDLFMMKTVAACNEKKTID